jgi:hypothetical protein
MVAPYDAYQPPDPLFGSPGLNSATTATFLYPGMPQYGHPTMTELQNLQNSHVGLFYDYSGASRIGSHFFYPQPIPFQHVGPLPFPPGGSPVFNKKRVAQVRLD